MQDAFLAFAESPENGLSEWGWPELSQGKIEFFGGMHNGAGYLGRHAVPVDVSDSLDGTFC